jgi:type IV secretory pathway TraG/TraD family ATPase VirD4
VNLDQPVLQFTDTDAVTHRHLTEGVFVFGQTGSGKTSGPGEALAQAMLRHGYGFLVLCAKRDEKDLWLRRAHAAGRLADVRVFGVEHSHRTNILSYALRPAGTRAGGLADNAVALLMALLEARDRQGGGHGEQQFWQSSAKQQLCCGIALLCLAGVPVTFEALERLTNSAPYSPAEVTSPEWQKSSFLSSLLDKIADRGESLSAIEKNDAALVIAYWLSKFPRMDDRTRSGILATVQSIIWPFQIGPVAELCGTETNLTPEDVFRGRIVILDLPIKEYHDAGLFAQTAWKLLFQRAAEARALDEFPRPVCLYVDEAHTFLTGYDTLFQATARSSRVATVYLTQNIDSVRARFAAATGKAEAEGLLGNFNLKVFCANDHVATNRWAADLIGQEWITRSNVNANFGEGGGIGASTNEQQRHLVPPITFMRLKKGGPENGSLVDAIVFRSGRPFSATGTNHLRMAFPQGRIPTTILGGSS